MNIVPSGRGSEDRQTQGINGPLRTPRPAAERRAGNATTASAASSLHLSARGERFLSLRTRLESVGIAQPDRVERLRERVAAGRYHVSGASIAAAMLADPATAAALGMK